MVNRRGYLSAMGTVGTIAIAGCALFQDIEDVQILNNTADPQRFTITITRSSDSEVVLDDTSEIEPSGVVRYQDPVKRSGDHRISVETVAGVDGEYNWDFEDEHVAVVVRIQDSEIVFERLVE